MMNIIREKIIFMQFQVRKDEQPDKGHTGFTTYQPCDTRSDKLGYWLCFIDSRARRILK